ncbi:DUF4767 domain-containing protein [Enterococcus sp. AZ109]|uniref:DUF4767 domain-containing protein n=1 Tax=Enterococcus sp. AZ109 TaxID=2774634 RepID=UPI003F1F2A1B
MKKMLAGIGILFCLFGLVGCNRGTDTNEESNSSVTMTESTRVSYSNESLVETESSSSTQETKESIDSTSSQVWNLEKSNALQSFMHNWGNTMGQSYKEYRPSNSVDFYGLNLPDGVLGESKTQPIAVNGAIVSGEWSDTGVSSADYTIVSVYSDAETAPYGGKHVYFFAVHNNQPIVLVSMQNQGMPDGAFHFSQTENQDLKNGFQSIFVGNETNLPVQTDNVWSSMDEAIQFYEDIYRNTANEISHQIMWENYDRKCWSLVEQNGNRIVLHWSNIGGAGGSYNGFIKHADNTTEMITYDGNISYPNDPSVRYVIQNDDRRVIETEELWNK